MAISKELLDIVVCPVCKNELLLSRDEAYLICEQCSIKYPIKENIPVLLYEESVPLNSKDR